MRNVVELVPPRARLSRGNQSAETNAKERRYRDREIKNNVHSPNCPWLESGNENRHLGWLYFEPR